MRTPPPDRRRTGCGQLRSSSPVRAPSLECRLRMRDRPSILSFTCRSLLKWQTRTDNKQEIKPTAALHSGDRNAQRDCRSNTGFTRKPKRPIYLTGSALALIILGVWYLLIFLLFVFLPMFYHYLRSNTLVPVLIGVGISASLALTVSGIGVIRRVGWARPLALLGLLILLFKIAFQALIANRQVSLSGSHWIEAVL